MNATTLRKELGLLYDEVSNANFNDNYQIKEAFFRLIRFNEELIAEMNKDSKTNEQTNSTDNSNYGEGFVKGVHEIINNGATLNVDILNWYRNLYYKEGNNTERGIMANAINNLFMEMQTKGIKLSSLYTSRID